MLQASSPCQPERTEKKSYSHTRHDFIERPACLSSLALPGDVIEFVETASSFSHSSITIRMIKMSGGIE